MPNVPGQRREPAADDVRFVSARIGWPRFAGPSGNHARECVILIAQLHVHRITRDRVRNVLGAAFYGPLDNVASEAVCTTPTQRATPDKVVRTKHAPVRVIRHRDAV